MSLQTWQAFLDTLTQRAAEENLLNLITKQCEKEIVTLCFKFQSFREELRQWMNEYLESSLISKSCEMSIQYRTKGNDKFIHGDNELALHYYSKSILVAPKSSEEYAVGIANRTAVLFKMKLYKLCLRDIDMVLQLKTYPKHLEYKPLLRQAKCLWHLGNVDECRRVIQEVCDYLVTKKEIISQKCSDKIQQDIDTLMINLDSQENVPLVSSFRDLSVNQCEIPEPKGGFNSNFASASRCVHLEYTEEKGRHVLATEPINKGDILFVEKPYTSVILPNQYLIHCHHCYLKMYAPIPCDRCCQALFCSSTCQEEAYVKYHKYECGALSLMWSIGIAHMGLRAVVISGPPDTLVKRAEHASHYFDTNKQSLGDADDAYSSVFGLVSHVQDMFPQDAFQYAMTAVLLAEYLWRKTPYFSTTENTEALVKDISAIILRHIAQLVCNAHAITKIDTDNESLLQPGAVATETQQRIATAIYPSASMMNHSCDPNISNSFFRNTLVVKASRNIAAGEEVFNCYGPHRARMSTENRQAALQAQYFFHCKCTACSREAVESEKPDRSSALCCAACKGALLNKALGRQPDDAVASAHSPPRASVAPPGRDHDDLGESPHRMVCAQCGLSQTISEQVDKYFRARRLFKEGLEASCKGDLHSAFELFQKCLAIQRTCLYHLHSDLAATQDQIAKCYAIMGDYKQAVPCMWDVVCGAEEQFGPDSVEVGHELRKLADMMILDIENSSPKEQEKKRQEAMEVVKRGKSIFATHYGEWDVAWQELHAKLEDLMRKKVCVY